MARLDAISQKSILTYFSLMDFFRHHSGLPPVDEKFGPGLGYNLEKKQRVSGRRRSLMQIDINRNRGELANCKQMLDVDMLKISADGVQNGGIEKRAEVFFAFAKWFCL